MPENESRIWLAITMVGVAAGLAFGGLIVLLLRDRRQPAAPAAKPLQGSSWSAPSVYMPYLENTPPRRSIARTLTVSTNGITQIARATGTRRWELQCRTVGPPGAMAMFICGNNPSDGIMVPAGSEQRVWLSPGEDLYAQSDTADTQVSVSGGEQ